jgi:hypothetical protein
MWANPLAKIKAMSAFEVAAHDSSMNTWPVSTAMASDLISQSVPSVSTDDPISLAVAQVVSYSRIGFRVHEGWWFLSAPGGG